jgi:hypothetical protein
MVERWRDEGKGPQITGRNADDEKGGMRGRD